MQVPNALFDFFIGPRSRSRRIDAQRKILLQVTECPYSWLILIVHASPDPRLIPYQSKRLAYPVQMRSKAWVNCPQRRCRRHIVAGIRVHLYWVYLWHLVQ